MCILLRFYLFGTGFDAHNVTDFSAGQFPVFLLGFFPFFLLSLDADQCGSFTGRHGQIGSRVSDGHDGFRLFGEDVTAVEERWDDVVDEEVDSSFGFFFVILVDVDCGDDARRQHPIALPKFVVFLDLFLFSRHPFALLLLQLLFFALGVLFADTAKRLAGVRVVAVVQSVLFILCPDISARLPTLPGPIPPLAILLETQNVNIITNFH